MDDQKPEKNVHSYELNQQIVIEEAEATIDFKIEHMPDDYWIEIVGTTPKSDVREAITYQASISYQVTGNHGQITYIEEVLTIGTHGPVFDDIFSRKHLDIPQLTTQLPDKTLANIINAAYNVFEIQEK